MSILNRYILGKFIKPFLASLASLCILLFVSQLFDRLDRFLQEGVSIRHVLGFLVTSLPIQALQVLPVACLLATLFVVGTLSRTREYVAGLAGGLAPEKLIGGLFWAGGQMHLYDLERLFIECVALNGLLAVKGKVCSAERVVQIVCVCLKSVEAADRFVGK